ncbi:MAG: type II toxin-antitoxin system HicB family antitoxin [Acidobacteriota bacterium]|nr:type II toxin-antitoxin system HicB family antitoxin [Acidobacteriota bacterium]MBU4495615.1 type II toxin-antitoxin system HicB family antitoxin [Acidobacteriota bacterium]MCG2817095.1 type II toxin-antitoxin system HicB family antitoxin [Candidatus Aminicenantes bacterium]
MNSHTEKLKFNVPVVIKKDGDGFHAYSPALSGMHTSGDTVSEALDNAKNAIVAYLMSIIKNGDPIPLCLYEHRLPKPDHSTFVYENNFVEISL